MTALISIPYYSPTGHTRFLAEHIARGAGPSAQLIDVETMTAADWQRLDDSHAIIFGAPTYMGSAASRYMQFLETAASRWDTQDWADKIAAGFTTAVHPSGDKPNALMNLCIYGCQMGMIWVGQNQIGTPVDPSNPGINRDGVWIGLSATALAEGEAGLLSAADRETARRFGARIAAIAARFAE